MTDRTKTGLEILQAAFLIGILGNLLLREVPWGLNVFLFVTAFVASMTMVVIRRRPELVTRQNIALCAAMVFLSSMFVWRDSIELRTIDTLAIITLMGVLMLSSMRLSAKISGVFHYVIGVFWAGINSVFAPAVLLSTDVKWNSVPRLGWSRHLIAAIRGILIALPLILIFGALFAAADAVYEGMIQRVLDVPSEAVFKHLIVTSIFFWLTAGYYRGILFGGLSPEPADIIVPIPSMVETPSPAPGQSAFDQVRAEDGDKAETLPNNASILEHINRSDPPNSEAADNSSPIGERTRQWQNFDNRSIPQAFTLGVIETSIVLGLMNLLFLSFVIVQIPYLFGGMDLVQATPDFKLAEYARRGFGELVAVTVLVLPILLASHWLLRKENPLNEKIYRVLAGVQIVLLFVVMASAVQRLSLLTGDLGYGLTTVRFYPMVVMIWFAIVFVWFGVTVLRGARQYFAWGALWSALIVLAGVHVLNPDAFIVRTNVQLMRQGRTFDAYYNSELSADAIPVLLESLDAMSESDRCVVKNALKEQRETLRSTRDLRGFTWPRYSADRLLGSDGRALDTSGCPDLNRFTVYD